MEVLGDSRVQRSLTKWILRIDLPVATQWTEGGVQKQAITGDRAQIRIEQGETAIVFGAGRIRIDGTDESPEVLLELSPMAADSWQLSGEFATHLPSEINISTRSWSTYPGEDFPIEFKVLAPKVNVFYALRHHFSPIDGLPLPEAAQFIQFETIERHRPE